MSPLLLFSLNCSRSAYFLQHSPFEQLYHLRSIFVFSIISGHVSHDSTKKHSSRFSPLPFTNSSHSWKQPFLTREESIFLFRSPSPIGYVLAACHVSSPYSIHSPFTSSNSTCPHSLSFPPFLGASLRTTLPCFTSSPVSISSIIASMPAKESKRLSSECSNAENCIGDEPRLFSMERT
jgi:hypothetical protein